MHDNQLEAQHPAEDLGTSDASPHQCEIGHIVASRIEAPYPRHSETVVVDERVQVSGNTSIAGPSGSGV